MSKIIPTAIGVHIFFLENIVTNDGKEKTR